MTLKTPKKSPCHIAFSILTLSTLVGSAEIQAKTLPLSSTRSSATLQSRTAYDPQLTTKTIAFWQKRVESDPRGAIALRELGNAYLHRAREKGTIEDVVRAEGAARHSLNVLPERQNMGATLVLARSLLTQHRFPEALAVADRAAKMNNGSATVQELRADILLELGEHSKAEQALAQIIFIGDSKKNDLSYKALRARMLESKGQFPASLALMKEASLQADQLVDMPVESVAWYHTMIGHSLIDRGRLEEGEKRCRRALQIFPDDYRAMTGLAEVAMWRGDWNQVIAWGLKSARLAPQNPEIRILLGEAYAAQGKTAQSKQQYNLLRKLSSSFPRIYDRNWASFLADNKMDLDQAIAIARRDLRLRQDVGAYETLAWACYKAGLTSEANINMDIALSKIGPRDASFFYRAALIKRASGQPMQAKLFMQRAQAYNPYFIKAMNRS